MNANDLTYGVEFETTMPVSFSSQRGTYSSPRQVNGLPSGWKAKTDCSIRAGRGLIGVEFVSPILKGANGLSQVLQVLAYLNGQGARVNQSTGFHVHVGSFPTDAKNIEKITTLVANFEQAIFASTGTTRRENGSWCKSVQRHRGFAVAQANASYDRYHVLNLKNLSCAKRTVEFRAFSGTLNPIKVVGYIRLCLGLVERALNASRKTNWTAQEVKTTSPIHRKGAGQTALTRLFYQLGWIKGRAKRYFGEVGFDIAGAPTNDECKKQLMRLAKQYDEAKAANGPQS